MSSSDAFWLNFWSLFATIGFCIVIIGVIIEGVEHFKKFPKKDHARQLHIEKIGWFLVVVGLAMEFLGDHAAKRISDREDARLNDEAGDARKDAEDAKLKVAQLGTTNVQLFASNLVLQSNVNETKIELANAEANLIELQVDNLPMDIGDEYSLAQALKPFAGMQVELRSAFDSRAQKTADMLSTAFGLAGWPVVNRLFMGNMDEQGIVIGDDAANPAQDAAHLLLKQLTDRNVPSEAIDDPFGFRIRGVSTNLIIVAVMQRPATLNADPMIASAKMVIVNDEAADISAKMAKLASERFVPKSKEMADAQAEYNDLKLQYDKLCQDEADLLNQVLELSIAREKEEPKTNSMSPGFHIHNSTLGSPLSNLIQVVGTNVTIDIQDSEFNPPPIQ